MEYSWREILNTISYLLRTACRAGQWRRLPHDLVKWWVTYRWLRTLAKDGTWRVIHDERLGRRPPTLRQDDERLVETSETMIDLAMIDVVGDRLAGGTRWRHWRTMTGPEPTPETA